MGRCAAPGADLVPGILPRRISRLLSYREMSVQYNYTHAATRLLSDAVALWPTGSREVAAHLAGLSAECVLKSVLVGTRLVAPDIDGQIPRASRNRRVRVHIDQLFGEFQAQLSG